MKIQISVVIAILSLLSGVAAFSIDWQREQDSKLAHLDKMIEKQKMLVEMQQKMNEAELRMRGVNINSHVRERYEPRDVER